MTLIIIIIITTRKHCILKGKLCNDVALSVILRWALWCTDVLMTNVAIANRHREMLFYLVFSTLMTKSPIFPALSLSSIIWFTTSTFPKDSCTTLCVHVETRARLSVTILLLYFLWRSALSKSFLSCYFILLVTWKRNVERVRDKWLHSKQMWGEEKEKNKTTCYIIL